MLTVADSFAENLYAVDRTGHAIYTFDSSASGDVTPLRTIKGAATTFSTDLLYGLAYYNNELYTGAENAKAILVFKATDDGNVAPTRIIKSTNSSIHEPRDLVVTGDFIYCIYESSKKILVFKTTDSGSVAATRTINFSVAPYGILLSNGELYVSCANEKVYVFDLTANGEASAVAKRVLDFSDTLQSGTLRGLFVSGGIIYLTTPSNPGKLTTFSASAPAPGSDPSPITNINGTNTHIGSNPYSLFVKNGEIFLGNFDDATHPIIVFKSTATGDAAPLRTFKSTGFTGVLGLAMETGDVIPANNQQSGVTVSVISSSSNATTDSELASVYSVPNGFDLKSPVIQFEATISSNTANGVFSFSTDTLNGTVSSFTLLKCFSTNGTTLPFKSYSSAVDPDTEGAWWAEDSDNNYLAADTMLTNGTKYNINVVVKDNGKYDEDRVLGQIKDPVVLGTSSSNSSTGCVFNPSAGFSLEWLLLGLGVLLSAIRIKLSRP